MLYEDFNIHPACGNIKTSASIINYDAWSKYNYNNIARTVACPHTELLSFTVL